MKKNLSDLITVGSTWMHGFTREMVTIKALGEKRHFVVTDSGHEETISKDLFGKDFQLVEKFENERKFFIYVGEDQSFYFSGRSDLDFINSTRLIWRSKFPFTFDRVE